MKSTFMRNLSNVQCICITVIAELLHTLIFQNFQNGYFSMNEHVEMKTCECKK